MIKKNIRLNPAVDRIIGVFAILSLIILWHNGTITRTMLVGWASRALVVLCVGFLVLAVVIYLIAKFYHRPDFPPEEALDYLKTRHVAGNRFETTAAAVEFVPELYRMGATKVMVDGIRKSGIDKHEVYADTFVVTLPKEPEKRKGIFVIFNREEKLESGEERTVKDRSQKSLTFWWD